MSTSGGAHSGTPTGAAGGDIAGTGTSTYPNPTLTAIGAATGPIGSTTVAPVVTIDTKGRVTALTQATIAAAPVAAATATLNGTAIAALFSAPTTLIAAPGANRVTVVFEVAYEMVAGVTSYDANNAGIFYAGAVDTTLLIAPTCDIVDALAPFTPASQVFPTPNSSTAVLTTTAAVNKAVVVSMPTANPVRSGAIVTSTLDDGGTGYVIGDTGTVDGKNYGTAAAYIVDTVGALGVVLTYHLTSAGTGYDTATNPHTTTAAGAQPGIGTGLELNVTAIPAADGTLYVTAYYATLTTH